MAQLLDNTENNDQIAIKVAISTIFFPIEKAKTLIQIGFEPLPPYRTRSLLGRSVLGLPNIFKYVGFMWREGGWNGIYSGCTVSALYHVSSSLTSRQVSQSLEFQGEDQMLERRRKGQLTQQEYDRLFVMSMARDLAARLVSIVVSHPLFVLKIRVVSQFIGEEQQYNGVVSGLMAIYRESGVLGFFSGVTPRLIAGAVTSLLVAGAVYVSNSSSSSQLPDVRQYTSPVATFFASTLVYPFQIVSTCCAVSGCSLQAGRPPFMPEYISWRECFSDLKLRGQLKRGSSLLYRTYTGPQVTLGGKALLF